MTLAHKLLLTLLLSVILLFSVNPSKSTTTYGSTLFLANMQPIEQISSKAISFELYDGIIYLPVQINDSAPLPFILDTGASVTVINRKIVDNLKLAFSTLKPSNVTGSGGSSVTTTFLNKIKLNISDKELMVEYPVAIDLNSLSQFKGDIVYGILGAEVFFRYVVEIDYASKTIVLYDPKNYVYKGSGEKLPLKFSQNTPNLSFVQATIEIPGLKPAKGTFAIDTGSNNALDLLAPFIDKYKLLTTKQKLSESLTIGVDGESKRFRGFGQNIQLGNFNIARPIVSFDQPSTKTESQYDGRIGNAILKRFKVIFDYSHKQMILEKGADFDKPFEVNMSGIGFVAEGDNFKKLKIVDVKQEASETGLKVGDEIISIDNKPSTDFSPHQVRQMFTKEGQEYLLKIRRGEEVLEVKLKMKPPF